MKKLLEPLWRLVYPEACVVCARRLEPDRRHLCPACTESLPWVGEQACPRCGDAAGPYANTTGGCVACRNRRFFFERAVAPFRYEKPIRELILQFKLGKRGSLAYALGDLLCDFLAQGGLSQAVDVVVPVPLHWLRRVSRGFNQAELLALEIGWRFGVPVASGLLRRRRATFTQTAFSGLRRGMNVRGAFNVRFARFSHDGINRLFNWAQGSVPVLGKRVLVVDDVFTTGSTVNECARMLKEAGAAEVLVATVARTHRYTA